MTTPGRSSNAPRRATGRLETLSSRLRLEASLVALGFDEASARRFGQWPRLAAILPEDATIAAAATWGPAELHAGALFVERLLEHRVSGARVALCLALWRSLTSRADGRAYLARMASETGAPGAAIERVTDRGIAVVTSVFGRVLDAEAGALARALRALAADGGQEAERVLSSARAAALVELDQAAGELTADVGVDRSAQLFARAARLDRRLGGDGSLRRRVVTAFEPVAWRSYTARRWNDLRALLSPVAELSDGLASELEADPSDLAFRASAAQLLVFRSEMAGTLSEQIALAERAFALCPTHRNARVVLAAQLFARADDARRRGRDASDDLARASALDPHHPRAKPR